MENMRNIIRLKDIPSNIIEEAIIIFKENKKVKKLELSKKFNENKESKDDDNRFIVKEAEQIISDYLKQVEDAKIKNNKKDKKWRYVSICLSVLLFISIIL